MRTARPRFAFSPFRGIALEQIHRPFFLDPIDARHVRLIERPPVRSHEVVGAVAIPPGVAALNGEAAFVHEPVVGRAEADQVVERGLAALTGQGAGGDVDHDFGRGSAIRDREVAPTGA
jgi:hypothetical protein